MCENVSYDCYYYYDAPRYSWNTAIVGIKHQSINQSINYFDYLWSTIAPSYKATPTKFHPSYCRCTGILKYYLIAPSGDVTPLYIRPLLHYRRDGPIRGGWGYFVYTLYFIFWNLYIIYQLDNGIIMLSVLVC
jgi:hypothetical protein